MSARLVHPSTVMERLMRTRSVLSSVGVLPGILALLLSLTLSPRAAVGQGVESDLARLAMENAERYVEPLSFGLGYAMSGGLFDSPAPKNRLGFEIGARVMGALPSQASERFDVVLPDSVPYNGGFYQNPYRVRGGDPSTPTATGEGSGAVLEPTEDFQLFLLSQGENPGDWVIRFPDGGDIPVIPFLVAHASVGIGWGTEIAIRLIPEVEVDEEVGGVSSFGFGIQHSLSQWLPGPSPVDVSAWFGRQNLKVGDYLEGNSNQYGIMAGRGFGPLTLYGSGMVRHASVDVSYVVEDERLAEFGQTIEFTHDLGSKLVFGVGARLKLLILNLSAQYTADEYSTVSLKVGLGFP